MKPELLFFVPGGVVCLVACVFLGLFAIRGRRLRTHVPTSYPDVEELVRQGRRVDAIRLYRRRTGVPLAVAKREVDDLRCRS